MLCDISVGKRFKAKRAPNVWEPHFKGSSKVLPNVLCPQLKKILVLQLNQFIFCLQGPAESSKNDHNDCHERETIPVRRIIKKKKHFMGSLLSVLSDVFLYIFFYDTVRCHIYLFILEQPQNNRIVITMLMLMYCCLFLHIRRRAEQWPQISPHLPCMTTTKIYLYLNVVEENGTR